MKKNHSSQANANNNKAVKVEISARNIIVVPIVVNTNTSAREIINAVSDEAVSAILSAISGNKTNK